MLGIGAQRQRHIRGQSTSAPSAAGRDELGGDGEGRGVPHTPSLGGTQPWHPDTHTFPTALPLGTTSHGAAATCQGHCSCAGSTWGDPGPPAPPEGPGSVWGGGTGGLEQPLIPVGSGIWHPQHPRVGLGREMLPPFPAGGYPRFWGLQCWALPVPSHSIRVWGGDPAVAVLCSSTSWICPKLCCLSSKHLPSPVLAAPEQGRNGRIPPGAGGRGSQCLSHFLLQQQLQK